MFKKSVFRGLLLGVVLAAGNLTAQEEGMVFRELENNYSEAEMTCCVSWIWEWVMESKDDAGQWDAEFGALVDEFGIMEVRYALFDVVPAVMKQRDALAASAIAKARCGEGADTEVGAEADATDWGFVGAWCEENLVRELRWLCR